MPKRQWFVREKKIYNHRNPHAAGSCLFRTFLDCICDSFSFFFNFVGPASQKVISKSLVSNCIQRDHRDVPPTQQKKTILDFFFLIPSNNCVFYYLSIFFIFSRPTIVCFLVLHFFWCNKIVVFFFFPVTTTMARRAVKDSTIRGYNIPRSAVICGNLYTLHKDPNVWEEPEEFRPSRFLDDKLNLVNTEKMHPFGIGR